MANLMICKNSNTALRRLNESEGGSNTRYILTGLFARLDELNRNQRIYTKEEYLKHLQYLREDIKKGEPLLGELDHPDDRFEVKLKEASHRVIDLWYDQSQNAIMGKIELLNTPNGKLAQSLVDQGIPLHISSRAAGSVNKDNTVSIQQIYTYDLVAKPGFADAVLHRVNESADAPAYTPDAKAFLASSLKQESMNTAPQYGILNEDVSITEISAPAILRKEAKELQINNQTTINEEEMTKEILESNADSTVGKPLNMSGDGAAALGIPTASDETSAKPATNEESGDDEDDKKKEDVSDSSDDAKDDTEKKDKDDSEEGDDKDDSKDSEGVEILDVRADFEGDDNKEDDDIIKDVKPSFDDDDNDKESESSDEDTKDKETEESNESKDADSTTVEGEGCTKDDKIEKKATEANKLNDAAKEDVAKRKESFDKKFDGLIDAIKEKGKSKTESKCESLILAQYPVSCYLNESNFAQFAALNESQKEKVVAYLQDNAKFTPQEINESWKNGINYVPSEPIWLKAAPAEYRQMYESADQTTKDAIAATAEYVLFESQYDINTFWENSGLRNKHERQVLNESFVNNMPKVAAPSQKPELPYGSSFINMVAEMACDYNAKY